MFCTECGHKLPDNVKFCTNCGAKLDSEPEQNQAPMPTPTVNYQPPLAQPSTSPSSPMVKCRECGANIKQDARTCPYCGAETGVSAEEQHTGGLKSFLVEEVSDGSSGVSAQTVKIIAVVAIVAVIIIGGIVILFSNAEAIVGSFDRKQAYRLAQEKIDEQLLSPATAKYPKLTDEMIVYEGEFLIGDYDFDVYLISSYVDSQNAAGVPVRTYFDIEIGLPIDEDVEKYYHNIINME